MTLAIAFPIHIASAPAQHAGPTVSAMARAVRSGPMLPVAASVTRASSRKDYELAGGSSLTRLEALVINTSYAGIAVIVAKLRIRNAASPTTTWPR